MIMIVESGSMYCNELEEFMWNEIVDEKDIQTFINVVDSFMIVV